MDNQLSLNYQFVTWQVCLLANNLLIGLRMFQYLMTHGGLRIYYNMFIFGSQLIQARTCASARSLAPCQDCFERLPAATLLAWFAAFWAQSASSRSCSGCSAVSLSQHLRAARHVA